MPDEYTFKSIPYFAIILGVGFVIASVITSIVSDLKEEQRDDSATIATNESWTWLGNNTVQSFAQPRAITSSVVVWCNVTLMGVNVNYSVSNTGVAILNQTADGGGGGFEACFYNMTYAFNYASAERNISGLGQTGQLKFANWFATIGLILGAIILIGILMNIFIPLSKRR